jgi:hypothetical protein
MKYGTLPKELNINGIDYKIRTDFRDILRLFEAFNDNDMSDREKWIIAITILFYDYEKVDFSNETFEKIIWFINCGKEDDSKKGKQLFSWEQDEQLMFSAINDSAKQEIRLVEYLHWWTFVGYFNNIRDGLFSTVMHIRGKLNKKIKLEKHEQDFYKENKHIVDIKKKYDDTTLDFFSKLKEKNMSGGENNG